MKKPSVTKPVTRFTPKQSPRASARAAQVIQSQKPTGISAMVEPKSTPSVKGSKTRVIDGKGSPKQIADAKGRFTSRTSPSPDALNQKERETVERSKITKEEKRFTTFLKRNYSPNSGGLKGDGKVATTSVKTARFDY